MENMGINESFWRDKRVLITGHSGFKGSWMSLWLNMLGAKVIGISLPPTTSPSLFVDAGVSEITQNFWEDIRHTDNIRRVVTTISPEIVFHLAAQPLVRASYLNPTETFSVNVAGTANVLNAVRSIDSVRAVVSITSDKCYKNNEWEWGYRESDVLGGNDPYSASKACAELVIESMRNCFYVSDNIGLASARAGNVIGGGDWAQDRLVPDLIRSFESGCELVIRYPEAVRPWQHVLEPIAGYFKLAESLWRDPFQFSSGWNFGPETEDECSVAEVIDCFCRIWGKKPNISHPDGAMLHEAGKLRLDISRAKRELGWFPRWPFEKAITLTANWHMSRASGKKSRDLCEADISLYSA